jgi:hypothetical protein
MTLGQFYLSVTLPHIDGLAHGFSKPFPNVVFAEALMNALEE